MLTQLQDTALARTEPGARPAMIEWTLDRCQGELGASTAVLFMRCGGSIELVGARGYPETVLASFAKVPLSTPFPLTDCIVNEHAIWIESPTEWAKRYPAVISNANGDRSAWCAIPIRLDGHVVAALGLGWASPQTFDHETRERAQDIANRCATALEGAGTAHPGREAVRLRLALEAGGAGTWESVPATGEFVASDRALLLHGLPPGTPMTHEAALAAVIPEDRPRVEAALRHTLDTGAPFEMELRVRDPNGAMRWLVSRAHVHQEPEGARLIGVVQDITEQKKKEAEFQERTDQLALLARISRTLILSESSESELLQSAFNEVAKSIGAELYFNYCPNDETSMRLCHWGGLTEDEQTLFATMRYGELLCGRVALQRKPIIVEDIAHTAIEGSELVRAAGYGAYAGFPLLAGDRLLGTIAFITRTKTHFRSSEVALMEGVCDLVAATLERRRLSAELSRSELRLRTTLEGAELGSFDLDLRLDRAVWDRRHAALLGYDRAPDPATYADWLARVHPDDLGPMQQEVERSRLDRTPLSVEHRLWPEAPGACRWLGLFGRFVYDEQGNAVRLIGVSRDITERKRIEGALRDREARLCEANELFYAALQSSPVIVFMQDLALRYTWIANPALGYDSAEVVGKTDYELFERREDAEALIALKQRVLDSRHALREIIPVQHNGQIRWYDMNVQPRLRAGELVGIIATTVDVTERKCAEDRAKQADRQKSEFLGILSHELRNPLAAIRSGMFVLERTNEDTDAVRRTLAIVHRQAEQLTRLVDDLLDITRITQGKLELRLTRLDVRELVSRACQDAQPAYFKKGVTLRYSDEPEALWVDADAARVTQIVGNLLANAVKFTSARGLVVVSLRRSGNTCTITVEDNGVGIQAQDLERIFDQFAQAESGGRHQGGLGIGLALVRELAQLHGGSVRALSDGPGRGSRFVVTLPLASAAAVEVDAPAAELSASARRVLIVEDNVDAATTLADLLLLLGHEVRTVHSGRDGIEALKAQRPEVLICDIGLPDISGYELVRSLRAMPHGQNVVAIALSGYAQERDVREARAAGFDAHLAKPPSLETLPKLLYRANQRDSGDAGPEERRPRSC